MRDRLIGILIGAAAVLGIRRWWDWRLTRQEAEGKRPAYTVDELRQEGF